jgi:tRNA-dihydrouridine synthase 3
MTETPVASGTAPVKAEYLLTVESHFTSSSIPDDDAAEGGTSRGTGRGRRDDERDQDQAHGPSRKKYSKEQKKAQRGANKGRRFGKVRDDLELCWRIAVGSVCEFGEECRFTHDIASYLAVKPKDIRFPSASDLVNPSFVNSLTNSDGMTDVQEASFQEFNTICPVFEETGECKHGFKCRFLGGHVRKDDDGSLMLIQDEEKKARTAVSAKELNFMSPDTLKLLRSKKYSHPIADVYLKEIQTTAEGQKAKDEEPVPVLESVQAMDTTPDTLNPVDKISQRTGDVSPQEDTPDVPIRFSEKKRLDWVGKTYLAPLTTVGNLPFRRLCVDYGADITCGDMGLATSFLAGSKEEWSLVRRYPSESIFGVQIAGSKPNTMVPTAEVIAKECAGNVDFVDINCGCPIDLVFRTGSGSALLDAAAKLGKIIVGMNKALGEIPVTVKLRTGVKDGRNTAHKLMPRLGPEFGAGCVTLHGRTRQQRYTKLADWDYIKQCVEAVRTREAEEGLSPVPIFGGGDCYSSQDYWTNVEKSGCDGVMVARGALIKPWIFTEIKERREWDISARERLDHVRKYAEYGLSHFGTDTAGVNTTRRYLCEALSFQYRYVPIGLLERLPGRLNDRAPAFRGRDDLESLLASGDSRDWVKISEMFLGPAPESWTFTPKHKSNAYDSQQG